MWLNAAAPEEAVEGCILGLPDFAEGQLSPRAGIEDPWHPRAHELKLLVGGRRVCPWRSFLYPPYSKEKLGPA